MVTEFIENHTYDEIRLGQSAELQRTLTRDDIALFSKVSGGVIPISGSCVGFWYQ
jgi:phosphate acetyltransferase